MRKYTQLALVIICTLSVIAMLVYQRKYANARLFLEVVDLFESHAAKEKCEEDITRARQAASDQLENLVPVSAPLWQEIDRNIHIYSTFWTNSSVYFVAILSVSIDTSLIWCASWNSTGRYDKSHSTRLKRLGKHDEYVACLISCQFNRLRVPVAVSLISGSLINEEQPVRLVPVFIEQLSIFSDRENKSTNISGCIHGATHSVRKDTLVEYLTYHAHIGLNNFYVYDEDLLAETRTFSRVPTLQGYTKVQTLRWNLPKRFKPLSRPLLISDCLLRSNLSPGFVAPDLTTQEFIVPRLSNLTLLAEELISPSSPMLYLHERWFCSEFEDDIVSTVLNYPYVTQRKVRYLSTPLARKLAHANHIPVLTRTGDIEGAVDAFVSLFNNRGRSKTKGVVSERRATSEAVATLNVYRPCGLMQNDTSIMDDFMLRYHSVLFGSKLNKKSRRRTILVA